MWYLQSDDWIERQHHFPLLQRYHNETRLVLWEGLGKNVFEGANQYKNFITALKESELIAIGIVHIFLVMFFTD